MFIGWERCQGSGKVRAEEAVPKNLFAIAAFGCALAFDDHTSLRKQSHSFGYAPFSASRLIAKFSTLASKVAIANRF